MAMEHWYVPAPGQADAEERAAALGLPLADASKAVEYGDPPVPTAVCDHNGYVVTTPEPTTFEEVWAAHDRINTGNPFSIRINEAGNLLIVTVTYADGVTVKSGTLTLV